jgi:hypothetical protein
MLEKQQIYIGQSKIFRTDAVKVINLTTKRMWKLPTSTQLSETWHTYSLDMVVLPSNGASRYHNCCIDWRHRSGTIWIAVLLLLLLPLLPPSKL